MEELISGYCRTQDAARMVLCEEDGGVWEADCDYAAGCANRDNNTHETPKYKWNIIQ